jgi:carboxylate-amine ligase
MAAPQLMLEHKFNGPPFTIGIEEELMILQGEEPFDLAQEVEGILADVGEGMHQHVKPEFMQSFLEVATTPCPDVRTAGEELRELRRTVAEVAERRGLVIGAAGTHPRALWEDQLIVDRPRYDRVLEELGYIARQFLIFGTHVHIGIDGPDRAIYVADGLCRYVPLFLGLSSNSPFLRGIETGMMSSRTPVYRALPRSGIPPHFGNWETYSKRVEQMMRSGAIEDYTFLWWDVRPHPKLGTIETRIFDQQTKVEETLALAALTVSIAKRLSQLYDEGEAFEEYPQELIDDNKIRAALRGMEGMQVDFRKGQQVPATEVVRDVLDKVAPCALALGCAEELAVVEDLLDHGTGARRQLERYERTPDLTELIREIAAETVP